MSQDKSIILAFGIDSLELIERFNWYYPSDKCKSRNKNITDEENKRGGIFCSSTMILIEVVYFQKIN